MILYRDTKNRQDPPPWLEGAPDLCARESAGGRLWCAGDPLVLGPEGSWSDLEDGWQARIPRAFDPASCLRRDRLDTYQVVEVRDLLGRIWHAPVLVDADGARVFRVARGRDWHPVLTPAQESSLAAAVEARGIFQGGGDLPVEAGCQYAAEFLALVNNLSPLVLAALGLMDERLALETLAAATSQAVKAETRHGDS